MSFKTQGGPITKTKKGKIDVGVQSSIETKLGSESSMVRV